MSDYIPEFKVGDLVIKAGERIAELEEQLAAAQTENERLKKSVVWDVVNALACADEYKCELAAAQAEIARLREGGCAREQHTTQYCAEGAKWCDSAARYAEHIARMDIRLEEAKELLLQAHEPDQGQLRTQWDKDVDEWIKKAAQAEITRLSEGGNIHNCAAVEEQIAKLEKDAAMLDWLADHEAVKNINHVNLSIYETAMCIAYERDVDAEPTVEDYRLALRLMIRTAINAEAAHGEGE